MESWDTLYPFTSSEINLFSSLHQKVTKFPAPLNLKTRQVQVVEVEEDYEIKREYFEEENKM